METNYMLTEHVIAGTISLHFIQGEKIKLTYKLTKFCNKKSYERCDCGFFHPVSFIF